MAKKTFFIPELYRHVDMENCSFNVLEPSSEFSLNHMHTNSGYNNYSQSGCTNHTDSGYSNYSQSGYSNHTNSGCGNHSNWTDGCYNTWYEYFNYSPGWANNGHAQYPHTNSGYSNYSQSGCSNHTNSGCATHSNSGANNHTNTGCTNHSNYSNNYSPTITGSCLPTSGTFNQTITLDWRGCTITHQNVSSSTAGTDSGTNAVKSYYVYYKRGSGGWTRLASDVTAQTYIVNTSDWTAGTVQFAITAYDGIEESVVFNSSSGTFSAPSKGHPDNAALSASYITTGTLSISHYTKPTWKYVVYDTQSAFRGYDLKEIHDEIVKASEAFGVSGATAITQPTANKTFVTKANLSTAQTQVNAVYSKVKGSNYSWSLPASSIIQNKTTFLGREILELRDSLEKIGE